MSFDLKSAVASIAPTLATMLGGPLAGTAVSALENALGLAPGAGTSAITSAVQAGLSPDAIAAVRAADQHHAELMGQQGIDLQKINLEHQQAMRAADSTDNESVNATMQAEAKSDHWPTYAWRPAIGFVFGANILVVTLVTAIAYISVLWFGSAPTVLDKLPAFIGAMSALGATTLPVLGVASYFRGKMQADPSVPTDNRG